MNLPTPSLSTTYLLALVTTVAGLAVTQGLITNGTAQLVSGLAAAFVPAILALAHTLFHAHTQAARINVAHHVVPVSKPAPKLPPK